jgi:hypothetical protein
LGGLAVGAAMCVLAASGVMAASTTTGAMSAFKGKVSCHWTRSSTSTTVRCWALVHPGQDAAVTTGDVSGRLAFKHWTPPVGPRMIFNHQYRLGNGVTCAFRYRRPTDTTIIKAVICSTSAGGPLIFAYPTGLAANVTP